MFYEIIPKTVRRVSDNSVVFSKTTTATTFSYQQDLEVATKYKWTVIARQDRQKLDMKTGTFTTENRAPRNFKVNHVINMRDLGGWTTSDGKRLRYGRLFRGGEMNNYYNIAEGDTHCISPEDSAYMHDVLKIRLELDLRDDRDLNLKDTDPSNDRNHTELGSDVEYVNIGRIARSLARHPVEGSRRGSVYIVQCKEVGKESQAHIIRFQKWGIAEHLDEGKDLLRSILEANEYSDYILDRRLIALLDDRSLRQEGMRRNAERFTAL